MMNLLFLSLSLIKKYSSNLKADCPSGLTPRQSGVSPPMSAASSLPKIYTRASTNYLLLQSTKRMSQLLLLLAVALSTSCASQQVQSKKDHSYKDLIRNGKEVYVEDKTFEDIVDFTALLKAHPTAHNVGQVNIKSSLTFKNCIFKKGLRAFQSGEEGIVSTAFWGNVSFIECRFEGAVNFRNSCIYGRTDFTKSTFEELANFEESTFGQNAFFNWCKFEKEHRFQNSFFVQKANFMNTEYWENASFQSAVFNAECQLSVSKFFKYADLSLIDSRGHMLVNYTEFLGKANFSHAHFNRNFDFVNTINQKTDFSHTVFMGKAKFFGTTTAEILDFKSCFFLFGKPKIAIEEAKVLFDEDH